MDFYVPRSAEEQEMETPHPTGESGLTAESPGHLEEQDACAVENYMGGHGLAAEEEYKWGHYTCGVYELSPSPPPCARVAPHEFHAASTASSMYPRSL